MNLPDPLDVKDLPSRNAEEYVRAKKQFLDNLQTLDPHNFQEFTRLYSMEHAICLEYQQQQGKTIHNMGDVLRRCFQVETILKAYSMLNDGQKMICENPAHAKVF